MIFEDSTMWKYRDLTELTQNKYFKEFISKSHFQYMIVEKPIVIYGKELMIVIYGYTIEDCIYYDVFHYKTRSIIPIWQIIDLVFEDEFCIEKYKLFTKSFKGSNSKYRESELDFSYQMWFLSNFGPDLNNFNVEPYLQYFITRGLRIDRYDNVVKTYLPELHHNS